MAVRQLPFTAAAPRPTLCREDTIELVEHLKHELACCYGAVYQRRSDVKPLLIRTQKRQAWLAAPGDLYPRLHVPSMSQFMDVFADQLDKLSVEELTAIAEGGGKARCQWLHKGDAGPSDALKDAWSLFCKLAQWAAAYSILVGRVHSSGLLAGPLGFYGDGREPEDVLIPFIGADAWSDETRAATHRVYCQAMWGQSVPPPPAPPAVPTLPPPAPMMAAPPAALPAFASADLGHAPAGVGMLAAPSLMAAMPRPDIPSLIMVPPPPPTGPPMAPGLPAMGPPMPPPPLAHMGPPMVAPPPPMAYVAGGPDPTTDPVFQAAANQFRYVAASRGLVVEIRAFAFGSAGSGGGDWV